MNTLHRYIFRELLVATLAGVGLFAFVLLTASAFRDLIGLVAEGKVSLQTTLVTLLRLFPFVLPYALPMGLLTAVLLTMGRLSAQNEVTAMRSAGIGLTRLGAPVLLIAVAGVAASLVINFSYAPTAKAEYREWLANAVRTNPLSFIVEKTFIRQFPGKVVYVGQRDGNTLRDFWIWEMDEENRVTRFIRAAAGRFDWREEDNYIMLVLEDARAEVRNTDDPEDFSKAPVAPFFGRFSIQLPLDKVFERQTFTKKVSWLNFHELVAEYRRLVESNDPAERARLLLVKMNFHEKAALSFSVLSFALIGVPLGIRTRRSETSANLGLALALTMGYYVLIISAGWLDNRPDLHPELLLWLPNALFQLLALGMWWRFGRNR